MSAMFKPPIAVAATIGWPQVFGFRQADDAFFATVRAAQLQSLNRYVPFNTLLMVVNIAALVLTLGPRAVDGFMIGWGIVMAGLALLWTLRFASIRRRGPASTASAGLFWTITAEFAGFGAGWAAMLLHLMPQAGPGGQALLLLLSVTAMGACGFAAAVMPVCAIALVVMIGGGTLVSLPPDAEAIQRYIVENVH